ncbi:hypothetical protein ABG827_10735, partial [Phocaeicola vulgatus]
FKVLIINGLFWGVDERNMGISVEHGECLVELFHIAGGRISLYTVRLCPTGTAGATALRYSSFLLIQLLNIVQLQFVI